MPVPPHRPPARALVALHGLVTAAALTLFAAATVGTALPPAVRRPAADLVLAAAALASGAVVLRGSRRGHPSVHRAWRCAGGACLAWGAGQLWFAAEHLLTGSVVRPGPCDVAFVLCLLLAVRGALHFPTVAGTRVGRGRALIDGAVVAGCALLLTWLLVLDADAEPGAALGLRLAYPLLDCAVATLLVGAAVRLPRQHRLSLSLALLGLLTVLATNLVVFALALSDRLSSPEPAEAGFVVAFALVALGSLVQTDGRTPAPGAVGAWQQLLPYGLVPPVLAALVVRAEQLTAGPLLLAALLLLLVLARQVLVVVENGRLADEVVARGRRYEALVRGSADLTLVVDAAGQVTWASPSAERLLGPVHGRRLLELVVEQDGDAARAAWDGCTGRTDGCTVQVRLHLPGQDDGGTGVVHVDARLTDLRSRPEVAGVVVNARDVTDRVLAQQALARSEQRYRRMVETAAEGLSVTDGAGVIRFVNDRLAEVLGLPAAELMDRPEREVVAALLDAHGIAVLDGECAARARGASSTYELALRRPDGSRAHVRVAATPLYDEDGVQDGSMALVTDITDRVLLQERLEREAFTDALTGLGNRRALGAAGAGRLAGRPLALLYVDLDEFKGVNDAWGHAAGDHLLSEVARRLRACVRDGDLVVRLGGDEFAAVLVDEPGEDAALGVAARFLQALEQPVLVAGHVVRPRASIGMALTAGGPDDDGVAELLRHADAALYRAKTDGRGRLHLAVTGAAAAVPAV